MVQPYINYILQLPYFLLQRKNYIFALCKAKNS